MKRFPRPSTEEFLSLLELVKETTIDEGHDEIIAEIDKYFDFPGSAKYARYIREAEENLLAQKQVAAEKALAKKSQINFGKIREEVGGMIELLNDRPSEAGTAEGEGILKERLTSLHERIAQACNG
ncbi:MAG TPA: hypothetical protein VMQ44_02390 [Candidatus Saccharimonadales bacterium]|nr:hypothetical protein [Candidatus Saccharimonadales bacterium]